MREGKKNPLAELIASDERVTSLVSADEIPELLRAEGHVGDATERARNMVKILHDTLNFV
jgi:adenylosuccinate lyase